MKYDGLIFDLDGTMWTCAGNVASSIKKMREDHPEIREFTLQDAENSMGFSYNQTLNYYFNEFPEEKARAFTDEFLMRISADIIENGALLYSDTVETLKKLRKEYKLFIVSNCGHGFVEAFMKQTGTEGFFTDYEYCSRTGLEKGGNIKLIVERNSLKNPAYVGDTKMDKLGAEEAGIDFIYAAYGYGSLNEEKTINSFSQLVDILEK